MRLSRVIFPTSIRLLGSAIITSIDCTEKSPDRDKYRIELNADLGCVDVTVLQGGLAGRRFGVPYALCTWEYLLAPDVVGAIAKAKK